MTIANNLTAVLTRIRNAEQRTGRPPRSVQLIAVSKLHSAESIREAYAAGQRDFGENYLQELSQKAEVLSDLSAIRFHTIGPIQSNKAKVAARLASMVHTVDSPSLASELGKRAEGRSAPLPVLIEVNIGGETQKHGCIPEHIDPIITAILARPMLQLRGLMTIPPHTEDPEGARPFFRRLREIQARYGIAQLPELSMGMSHDLEVAIEEGATLVRVGTAIFGERPQR